MTVREALTNNLSSGTNDEMNLEVDNVFADDATTTSASVDVFNVNDDVIDVNAGNVGDDDDCADDIHGADEGTTARDDDDDGADADAVITMVRVEDTGSNGRKLRWSTTS